MKLNDVLSLLERTLQPHLTKTIMPKHFPHSASWRDDKTCNVSPRKSYSKTSDFFMRPNFMSDLRRPYRILCLDGGGVKGALTGSLLQRIVEHRPEFLDQVDFICGTSVGGILALLIGAGYSPKETKDLFNWAAPYIFKHSTLRKLNPFRSKYSDKAKQEIFQEFFGDRTMKDLSKTCAVVNALYELSSGEISYIRCQVAFRLDGRKSKTHSFFQREGWRPAVFSNMPRAEGEKNYSLNLCCHILLILPSSLFRRFG